MQFLNPALLVGLGLVALPIVIHLLNRRRFRVVRWAAMDFLLQANRRNRRRIRIEHLLVLLLRCLALALLALAVARPLSSSAGLALLPGVTDPVERIVVLDDSGSMAYRNGQSTSFARARRTLERLVADLRERRPRDFLSVFRASRPDAPDLLLSAPGNERTERFLARLGEAEPTQGGFDVARSLERALTREEEAPRRAVVYLVTDLRARDWIGEAGELPARIAAVLQRSREEAPEGTDPPQVVVVDVGSEERHNLGIVALEPSEKLAMAGVPLELELRVRNHGPEAVRAVPLVLEAGEERVPLPPVERIDAGEEAVVRHRYTFAQAGSRALAVRLAEDALPLDDARYLALEVQDRLEVLLVDGEEGAGPLQGETDLLRLALAPPGDGSSGVEPEVTNPVALGEEELSGYDALVLCNLNAWPAERRDELERFVERGGGLAVFLGERVDGDAYERVLYRGGQGLLPARLGPQVGVERDEDAPSVAPPAGSHPLTAIFEGDANPFLARVRARVRRELALSPERDAASRVLLQLNDAAQTPFLLEKPVGRGRVLLFNTTADLAWSSWPRDPSYPVTAQELVQHLAPRATEGRNLGCGEALRRPLNPARFQPTVSLQVPAAGEGPEPPRELHAEPRPGTDTLWVDFAGTERAGIYTLELRAQEGTRRREQFAANLDPSEGQLLRADPARLRAAFPPEQELAVVRPDAETELLTLTDGTQSELWRTCLLLCLLALLLEQVLAWRAAHHRRDLPAEAAA